MRVGLFLAGGGMGACRLGLGLGASCALSSVASSVLVLGMSGTVDVAVKVDSLLAIDGPGEIEPSEWSSDTTEELDLKGPAWTASLASSCD